MVKDPIRWSLTLQACLQSVNKLEGGEVHFRNSTPAYQMDFAKPYNLAMHNSPVAVAVPKTPEYISRVIKCAKRHNAKVQARSGGYSYANYALGPEPENKVGRDNGTITVDMSRFRNYGKHENTNEVTLGSGLRLKEVDAVLEGLAWAFPHGVCPEVGLGGHATLGGLGPMSRMWGTTSDHITAAQVVKPDGSIVRVNESSQDLDMELFWAIRGAGPSFGIVTEFTIRTHPQPRDVTEYSLTVPLHGKPKPKSERDVAAGHPALKPDDVYQKWQTLVLGANLDQRFGSELVLTPAGLTLTGVFYGNEVQFTESGIPGRLPPGGEIRKTTYFDSMRRKARQEAAQLPDVPTEFDAYSLALTHNDLVTPPQPGPMVPRMLRWLQDQAQEHKGPHTWAFVLDMSGGAVGNVSTTATAFAHRDKVLYAQLYVTGAPELTVESTRFMSEALRKMRLGLSNPDGPGGQRWGMYPGYVNPQAGEDAQAAYWQGNLPRLQWIKRTLDPEDVLRGPQGVRHGNPDAAGVDYHLSMDFSSAEGVAISRRPPTYHTIYKCHCKWWLVWGPGKCLWPKWACVCIWRSCKYVHVKDNLVSDS